MDKHPAVADEQAHLTRAWTFLDKGFADAEQSYHEHGATNRSTQRAMHRALEILRESRGDDSPLIAGRMDVDGEAFYIGRRGVHDDRHDRLVINWHAPFATRYFEATADEPQGVQLKRVFVEEDRAVRQLFDEIVDSVFQASEAGPTISDALLAELERTRDGAMREVIATIQAEQFRIIRAPREAMVVVQGGPGTGKTVVGLHRAVWLAFNHEDLRRQGILVVAPNTAFLSYVSGVLPSLDARDLQQADLLSLYAGEAGVVGSEEIEASFVKGSERMATVLQRALYARIGWTGDDLQLALGADRFAVPGAEIRALVDEVRNRRLTYAEGRGVLRPALSALAFRYYTENQEASGRPKIANEQVIRRLSAFANALDRIWPTFTPEELLRSLFGTQTWLEQATDGVLAADERARLFRASQPNIADEPWTRDDVFCLDELSELIYGGTATYGHIVVDEAQDMSPMQARALSRRCPSGSFTVLGDLAQATGAWVRDEWTELSTNLADTEPRLATLSIGYRVPASVLELAAAQLPLISPGLTAPSSVRRGRGVPVAHRASPNEIIAYALRAARSATDDGLSAAIIVTDARYDEVLAHTRALGADVGDGRDGDFAKSLTLVPAHESKGLEFDSVTVLEPGQIVASSPQGRRLLYVAMTRPTQELFLIHSDPLPAGLEQLDTGPGTECARPMPPPKGISAEASLAQLIEGLDDEDRNLVERLVRRLGSARREGALSSE